MMPMLAVFPWLVLLIVLPFLLWRRPRLQDYPLALPPGRVEDRPAEDRREEDAPEEDGSEEAPSYPAVSIILPTSNDADRVGTCLATLLDSRYPDFEVIVVDHDSRDGTREIVQALRSRSPHRLRLIRTGPVPDDRPWRAWACLRGCREASGELLLFTEPGSIHDDELLERAVAALRREEADLLTVQPRLTMHGFWERLVMPHIWLVLRARFPSAQLVNRSRSPRNVVGHHQFLLFRKEAYERMGGHEVVGPGGVEDLAVPQAVMKAGLRLFVVHGDAYLETRMFRSYTDLSSDWTAAVPPASRTTVAPWAGAFIPWLVGLTPAIYFVVPPVLLLLALLLPGLERVTEWGVWATALSLLFWLAVYAFHRIRPAYAVAYPVGALATSILFIRSVLRDDGDNGPPPSRS